MDTLDRRNLLAPFLDQAARRGTPAGAHWAHASRTPAGHFAGIPFFKDQVDTARWPWRLNAVTDSLAVDMASIEAAFHARAASAGVRIVRGCAIDALEQTASDVTVRAGNRTFQGRWLVGCDGGRSTVRKAGGFDVVGTGPEFTGCSLLATLSDTGPGLMPGRHHTLNGMVTYQPPGTIAVADFDGGAFHRTDPITLAHVQSVLRRVSGIDVIVTDLAGATTWTDRAFQATSYRKGRVLLAGDAAHIHAPLGGQGLNLGLGDAMNLGWKLSSTIRGDAPDGLLDSYGLERHPVGAQVLDWSRAQVALMRPDAGSRALAGVMRRLIDTQDGASYMAERAGGVSMRYDLGDGHPLVGRSAPNFTLRDGTTVNARLRHGQELPLDTGDDRSLRSLAGSWTPGIKVVAREAEAAPGLGAMLLRPDGIVAWARDVDGDVSGFASAAARWFGKPTGQR